MAKKTYRSVSELQSAITAQITKDINSVMNKQVLTKFKKTLRSSIIANVYNVYSPKRYVRRGDNGGLRDKDNMVVLTSGVENEFLFTTLAEGDGKFTGSSPYWFPKRVNNGLSSGSEALFGNRNSVYNRPRDFMTPVDAAKQEWLLETLKTSLSRSGYKIRRGK